MMDDFRPLGITKTLWMLLLSWVALMVGMFIGLIRG